VQRKEEEEEEMQRSFKRYTKGSWLTFLTHGYLHRTTKHNTEA